MAPLAWVSLFVSCPLSYPLGSPRRCCFIANPCLHIRLRPSWSVRATWISLNVWNTSSMSNIILVCYPLPRNQKLWKKKKTMTTTTTTTTMLMGRRSSSIPSTTASSAANARKSSPLLMVSKFMSDAHIPPNYGRTRAMSVRKRLAMPCRYRTIEAHTRQVDVFNAKSVTNLSNVRQRCRPIYSFIPIHVPTHVCTVASVSIRNRIWRNTPTSIQVRDERISSEAISVKGWNQCCQSDRLSARTDRCQFASPCSRNEIDDTINQMSAFLRRNGGTISNIDKVLVKYAAV